MASIVIQPERPDHPAVAGLLAALDDYLGSLYPPEENHILGVADLLVPSVLFLAAFDGDEIVGCGAVRRMPGEPATEGAAYGEIKRMYVKPQARGRRIAERLLAALEDSLGGHGIDRSLLETGSRQPQALRLYERAGYRARAPFGGYEENGTSLFLEKRLMPA